MSAIADPIQTHGENKSVELVGVSTKSWSDAARRAVAQAAETYPKITAVDLTLATPLICNGEIVEYRAKVKVTFLDEP